MKVNNIKFSALLLSLTVALLGCGGGSDEPAPSTIKITASPEAINAPATASSYEIKVTTTGNEWDAYATGDFFTIEKKGTSSASGTVTVNIPSNPSTKAQSGSVVIMSGAARKTIIVGQEGADQDAYYAPEGYHLVWHDEFDSGTELNSNYWTHEVQNSNWVNHELQNYVNHLTPGGARVTEIKNGSLRITCLKEDGKIYSARVYANKSEGVTYGYIEARIKLPKGKGTWPAFWMMPVNFRSWPADGEIDIMEEVGYHPDYVSSSLHANAHVHTKGTQVTHEMYCPGAEGEFHTYAILWTAQNITTYVDGQVQLSYDNRGLGRDDWPYDDPFYVILNLAWGGDWGGQQGVDESKLPLTMEVDYLRIFQK